MTLDVAGQIRAFNAGRDPERGSAGQGGSASVDALIEFGRLEKWRAPLLAAARDCAAQVLADAAACNAAFDAGFFAD